MQVPYRSIVASIAVLTASAGSHAAILASDPVAITGLSPSATASFSGIVAGPFSASDTKSVIFNLPKWNPALGTLNSATFSITFSTTETTATFNAPLFGIGLSAISLDRSLSLAIDGLASPVATASNNLIGNLLASTLGFAGSVPLLSAVDGTLNAVPAVGNLASGALTDPITLAALTGPGNLDLTLTGIDEYSFRTLGVGSSSWGGTSEYGGSAIVTFDFTPVPEPSSVAIFATGAILLLVLRRRKLC